MTNQEPSGSGTAARAAAAHLIQAALSRRGGIDDGLSAPGLSGLEPRDRAFARALAMSTLRHLRPIDRVLDAKLQKAPPEQVRDLLRIGAAQLFYLGTPPHAAVAATVELADQTKAARPFKGLINAILRALSREGAPPDGELAPDWIMNRWRQTYGAGAEAIDATIGQEPATDLSLRSAAEADGLAAALDAASLPGGSLRTQKRGDLAEWPGYAEGRWWVQDASAAIPVRLIEGLGPGKTAVDLCAAPGGKTLQLAAAGAAVTAVDRNGGRLLRVAENLSRMGLTAETVEANALDWDDARTFDAVLLDAPCTATGTFRRHPETLWALKPPEIPRLSMHQARLMDAAAKRVASGGTLIYCVCSLEPEEGEAQIGHFLNRNPQFGVAAIEPGEGGAPAASVLADGTLRILPHHIEGGTDGFFVARFVRI